MTILIAAEWWTGSTAGWIGGLGGGGVGLLGALLGGIGGPLAQKGRARPLVVGGFVGAIALCALSLGAGLVALALGQPYHVWYPLVLPGAIGTLVFGMLLPQLLRAYARAEQRRVEAESLRRT
jgi:hypothetical protein